MPTTRSPYQEAASCSSASARALKRRRLLATEALLETSEYLVSRNGRDSASVDVLDATLDLAFPVFPQISKLQARRELVDQDLTLLLRQLKRGFQNFLRLQHVPSVARPAHDEVSFCTGPQLLGGSGPTIAGGARSVPPVQSAGRGPGELAPLFKPTVEAESASASAEAPASAEAR